MVTSRTTTHSTKMDVFKLQRFVKSFTCNAAKAKSMLHPLHHYDVIFYVFVDLTDESELKMTPRRVVSKLIFFLLLFLKSIR